MDLEIGGCPAIFARIHELSASLLRCCHRYRPTRILPRAGECGKLYGRLSSTTFELTACCNGISTV